MSRAIFASPSPLVSRNSEDRAVRQENEIGSDGVEHLQNDPSQAIQLPKELQSADERSILEVR